MESLENKNMKEKMKEDVKLSLEIFLRNEKSDEWEVQNREPIEI